MTSFHPEKLGLQPGIDREYFRGQSDADEYRRPTLSRVLPGVAPVYCGCGCGRPAEMVNPAPSVGVPDDWAEVCWTRHCFDRRLDPFNGLARTWLIDDDLTVVCMFCGQQVADLFTPCPDAECVEQTAIMRRAAELMDAAFEIVPCIDIKQKRWLDDIEDERMEGI